MFGDTPAAVLTTLPDIACIRASNYGGALGDPTRFGNADAAYRYSGLVPTTYSSAGTVWAGERISREGSVLLREAIIELGRGVAQNDPDFAAYKAAKIAQGKKRSVAAIAVAHRAHRLAFAMIGNQQAYDPHRWADAVAAGKSAMATTEKETDTTT